MKVSSDYPRDQYVCYVTGSVTASGSGGFSFSDSNHNLSFIPLIYVQWSETIDFETPRELWQNSGDAFPLSEPWIINARANKDYVSFEFQNWGTSTKTLYFRAWGFMPSNVSADTYYTSGITGLSKYITNSDMNYLKLIDEDVISVPSSGTSVNHNLGYLPVVMIWFQFGTGDSTIIEPLFSPIVRNLYEDGTPTVDTSSIVFPGDGFSTKVYHYRIYKEPIYG